jgi:predicted ATP-dependent protease
MNHLSARAHDRVLKLARTIADLEGSEQVHKEHVESAVQHRCLDKPAAGRPGRRITARDIARHLALHTPGTPPGELPREGT